MTVYNIYTDGCITTIANKNLGGWGLVVTDELGKITHEDFGAMNKRVRQTIENSELDALYRALEYIKNHPLKNNAKFTIYSDSNYVVNCMNGLSKRRNCREMWDKIEHIMIHDLCDTIIDVKHVLGHQYGDTSIHSIMNNHCDKLAKIGANLLIKR